MLITIERKYNIFSYLKSVQISKNERIQKNIRIQATLSLILWNFLLDY